MSAIRTENLACGMPLLLEPMAAVQSVAVSWLLPMGSATDDPGTDGAASMLSEMVLRGAGDLDSRGLSDALDRLGVQRSTSVERAHLRLSFTLKGDRLLEALPLIVSMVRTPHLPADAVDAVRSLSLQMLASLDDDPQQLVMLRLGEEHNPTPFNRHGYGTEAGLGAVDSSTIQSRWADGAVPHGSILSIAGAIDPGVPALLDKLLSGWSGTARKVTETASPRRGVTHVEQDTSQVHLALAWDAPPEPDDHSMLERLMVGILSGSTSARLFTEVRQKRSLCYSVGARYHAGRDRGLVSLYAGTTPERAQETLDVSWAEIMRLAEGARADEFARVVAGIKSRLIMQGESTRARAGALGSDMYRLGRTRSLDELAAAIDAIDLDTLNTYMAGRIPGELTFVMIGPDKLTPPAACQPHAGSRECSQG